MSITQESIKVQKRAGRGFLLALSMIYFYFCDDIVLAAPIIAVTLKWGILPATLFGAVSCALWNIPQTLVYISAVRSGEAAGKYVKAEKVIKFLGWCQPPVVLYLALGWWGFVAGTAGVVILRYLTSWIQNHEEEAGDRLESRLGRVSDSIWNHHRWALYFALFFIGPQMSLLPALKSSASTSEVKRIGFVLIAVYAVEFALGYTIGVGVISALFSLFT